MIDEQSPVAIVLLNYNGANDTLDCIESLFSMSVGFRQLIVCDNASTDDSLALITSALQAHSHRYRSLWRDWGNSSAFQVGQATRDSVLQNTPANFPITIVDNQKNWGFAGGNNVGIRIALDNPDIHYVWLLNNDTRVCQHALKVLLSAAQERPAVGLWGATILYDNPPNLVQTLGGGTVNRETAETRHLCAFMPANAVPQTEQFTQNIEAEMAYVLGASMFATRAWIETVGLLNESYFLYYEELDWAERGRHFFPLGYARDCIVVHKEGASIGTAPNGGTPLSVHHLHRSKLIFARRLLPRSVIPRVVASSIKQQLKYLLRGKLHLARAAASGMIDGLRVRYLL